MTFGLDPRRRRGQDDVPPTSRPGPSPRQPVRERRPRPAWAELVRHRCRSAGGLSPVRSLKIGVCGEHGGDPFPRSTSSPGRAWTTSAARRSPCRLHGLRSVWVLAMEPRRRSKLRPSTGSAPANRTAARPGAPAHARGTVRVMAIPDDDVTAVRSATDILALIGEYTPLKRVGRRYVGLCPFHAEKTGSFSVNAEEGLYYCFGCQASGDAITFLRNIEGCDFVEAVERLATRAGIAIRHDSGGKDRPDRGKGAKRCSRSWSGPSPSTMRSCSANRMRSGHGSTCDPAGHQGEVVRQFGLGWAPETGRSLVGAVRAPADLLVKAGLAHQIRTASGTLSGACVIFPIFDPTGKAIGLGGRILPASGEGAGPNIATPRRLRSTRKSGPSTGSTGPNIPSSRPAR